jgi:hypothetical protein
LHDRDVFGHLDLQSKKEHVNRREYAPMTTPSEEPKKRRRERGDDGISWDKTNKCYVGTISLGFKPDGKRDRRHRTRQDEARRQGQTRQAPR